MTDRTVMTEDAKEARKGDRVFNYYDGKWGVIGDIDSDGWFTLVHDDGTRATLNGERVATYNPQERNPSWPLV